MNERPLNILIISFDRKNIFEDEPIAFRAKLERDKLRPDFNRFFYFAWSTKSYHSKPSERLETVHVKTVWGKFKPYTDFATWFLVPRALRRHDFKPDVVLIYDLGYVPAARKLRRIYGSKIVLGMLNMPRVYSATRQYGLIKSWYSMFLEKFFLRSIDVYYTINLTMKNYLVDLGARPDKIFIFASDTIERDKANIAAAAKGRIRQKYGIKENQKIILSIGRLEAEKGYPELFGLFSKLEKNFVLIVLGRGHLEKIFKKLTVSLGIADRAIFAGYASRQEIWNYYADADLFCLLSSAEALGLVFWESMYMGVPVIGSTASGIAETIGADGERGFIYDPATDDFEAFNKKVKQSLEASEERSQRLARAKAYVEAQIANPTTINDVIPIDNLDNPQTLE